MAYKKFATTGGKFYKWEEEGQQLEGIWLGVTPGKFGDNGNIVVDNEKLSFGLSTALKDLAAIPTGTKIKIVMTGYIKTKGGKNPMKTFDLYVEDPSAPEPTEDAPQRAGKPKGEDDIPF